MGCGASTRVAPGTTHCLVVQDGVSRRYEHSIFPVDARWAQDGVAKYLRKLAMSPLVRRSTPNAADPPLVILIVMKIFRTVNSWSAGSVEAARWWQHVDETLDASGGHKRLPLNLDDKNLLELHRAQQMRLRRIIFMPPKQIPLSRTRTKRAMAIEVMNGAMNNGWQYYVGWQVDQEMTQRILAYRNYTGGEGRELMAMEAERTWSEAQQATAAMSANWANVYDAAYTYLLWQTARDWRWKPELVFMETFTQPKS
ncbi:unnamed protein product [Effrenium voratum]|uniref:Uncharacterized protein n=1 Tax=Effrenium voratum TaxID=2562239 RepID=A0AA36JC40_9DINO|nr:unnamed protein product [Effrenium voratum]